MLWAAPGLRAILTPPDPNAALKARIADAVKRHARRANLRSELSEALRQVPRGATQ